MFYLTQVLVAANRECVTKTEEPAETRVILKQLDKSMQRLKIVIQKTVGKAFIQARKRRSRKAQEGPLAVKFISAITSRKLEQSNQPVDQ